MTRRSGVAWQDALGAVCFVFVARIVSHLRSLDIHAKLSPVLAVTGVVAIVVLVIALALLIMRRGSPALLLCVQATAVFAPYLVIGQGWGMAGMFLCAGILLVLPRRPAVVLFAVVAVGDAALCGYLTPSTLSFVYAVFVNVANGFAIFAIVRLAQLVRQTHEDGRRLADVEVEAERLRAADRLGIDVGTRLSAIIGQSREALTASKLSRTHLTVIGGFASQAATDARTIANIHRNISLDGSAPARQAPIGVGVRFAAWAHLLIVADFIATSALNMFWHELVPDHMTVGIVVVLAIAALQLYLGAPRASGTAVRWWPVILAAQISLIVGATLMFFPDPSILIFLALAGGTALVRMPAPWSWFAVAANTVALLAYFHHHEGLWSGIYFASGSLYWAAVIYALHNLPQITHRLHSTWDELTRMAVITERLRLARDIHDLLGFHLSVIKLKIELAVRTSGADHAEARDHLTQAQRSAEQALTEVRTFTTALDSVTCRDELFAARAILRAGGATVTITDNAGDLPRGVDNLIGIIVREAATNIIRHARAENCTFDIAVVHGELRVRITNDGAERPHRPTDQCPPAGLTNLRSRIEALGGSLTAVADHGTFTLTASLTVDPAVSGNGAGVRVPEGSTQKASCGTGRSTPRPTLRR
ncbi:sensor histidine kinase [Actinomadura sp. 3N407]|uniref:sensor histidine kinase n=1 Tax=Actinomadura sp. 3N407 TaxID=3457423 RepID=UPI003FCC5845